MITLPGLYYLLLATVLTLYGAGLALANARHQRRYGDGNS
jgi:hypothetical protein